MTLFELGSETVVIILLLIASIVAIVVRYVRVPYTVALVLVGLAVGVLQVLEPIELTPHVILVIFLPALLFEAALHLDFEQLRDDVPTIFILAVPGVLISSFLIGGILYLGARALGYALPLSASILFGVLISATDPVAVLALFRQLGVPRRLQYVVEGESLFNDATAIVLYSIVVGAIVSGEFHPTEGVIEFLRVSLGGVALGGIIGYLLAQVMRRLDDYLIEVTLTTILAYGAFLVAEQLHVSGVMAVVIAGMLIGNYGIAVSMSPTTHIVLTQIWEYIGFIANSLIFLLIGLGVDLLELVNNLTLVILAIGVTLIARATVIYGLGILIHRVLSPLPMRWRHVLFWGGLRGAIALALALSLPMTLPQRSLLQGMTFGVVLFTLVIQGLSMASLLKRLRLQTPAQDEVEYERRWGQLYALEAAWRHVERLHRDNLISDAVWRTLKDAYTAAGQHLNEELQQLLERHPKLQARELQQARLEALRAERSALNDLLHRGLISEEIYRQLSSDVDRRIADLSEDATSS